MDIISHAIAGASAGAMFQRPIFGAAVAVLPDLVLGVKRVSSPTVPYRVTHSLLFVLFAWAVIYPWGHQLALCAAIALASHLLLDLPTHGPVWAPRLFYPFSDASFDHAVEWEWFSTSWFIGLGLTVMWSVICLTIAFNVR